MRRTVVEEGREIAPSFQPSDSGTEVQENLTAYLFERDEIVQVDENGCPVPLAPEEEAIMNAMPPRRPKAV